MLKISSTSFGFTLLLGFMAGLPALSIDLSAPTLALLPMMLHTSVFVAGLSLSLFVLGFGFGQFAGGRASDLFGRKPTLRSALILYVLAGSCCVFATSGPQLALMRLLQGLGAGGCSVQAYAIVQDVFAGREGQRKQAQVGLALTLMPMIAPALGTLLIALFGWRSVHSVLVIGGLLLLLITQLRMGETWKGPAETVRRSTATVGLELLRDAGFRRLALVNALSYASIFAYIAGAPVVVMSEFGYPSEFYAGLFACTAASLSAGAFASAALSKRMETRRLVPPSLFVQALAGIVLTAAACFAPDGMRWLMVPPLLLGCFVRGIISPNLVFSAVSRHRAHAGLASAVVGLMQLTMAAVASTALARVIGQGGALSVASTIAALASAGALLFWAARLDRVDAPTH